MKKPILLLLAAGMGSRYGGLKQIDPIGENGEILMDYSLYDAKRAGFERVLFIIKKQDADAFASAIGHRIGKYFDVSYAYQSLDDLPDGFALPDGRVKPWGTAHAVLAARQKLDAPFAVLNADDYYGPQAFAYVYQFLSDRIKQVKSREDALMVNYVLRNTLSEHGHVARGICRINKEAMLEEIVERSMIRKEGMEAAFSEDGGGSWQPLPPDVPVSMNFWGFDLSFVEMLEDAFPEFLCRAMAENPLKGEFLLPSIVGDFLKDASFRVRCQTSHDQWYGVTYKEDKPQVMASIRALTREGRYPEILWQ